MEVEPRDIETGDVEYVVDAPDSGPKDIRYVNSALTLIIENQQVVGKTAIWVRKGGLTEMEFVSPMTYGTPSEYSSFPRTSW